MKILFRPGNRKYPIFVMTLATIVVVAISLKYFVGHTQSLDAGALQESNSANSASTSMATVNLSPDQLNAIKIGPVGKHLFPVKKEAVGSINWAEDISIVQAEATLIGAAATYELTSKELARAKALYSMNIGVSQRELEQAISDQKNAESAYDAARETVLQFGMTTADIDRLIRSGKTESTSYSISRISFKWALASVTESDTPLFHVGQLTQISVPAYPDRVFEGRISKIYLAVDPNSHRTNLRAKIADPKNELRPGMLANFTIQVHPPIEALSIPANGVVHEGDGTLTAWVTTDRRHFTQRIVKIGMQDQGMDEVLDGLHPGELAVIDGAIFLDNMLQAPPSD